MTVYLESSALAKLLRPEPGHETARAAFSSSEIRATSTISYPELCATMAAWDPRPGSPATRAARQELERAWPALYVLQLDEPAARLAGEVALRHRLRGMDAIHVAAAIEVARGTQAAVSFVTWDREQRAAARREGFELVPEEL